MTEPKATVAIVLAAGLSRRFAGDKLLHLLDGKPLAEHIAATLSAMPLSHRLAVCPAGAVQRTQLFAACGFEIVENPQPEAGMGTSLSLGARRALELGTGPALVCLADMPHVTPGHLEALLAASRTNGAAATVCNGVRSPPAAFRGDQLIQLAQLSGDVGARSLLGDAALVAADPLLVRDYDTLEDFRA